MGKYNVCPVCGSQSVDFTGNSEDVPGAILVSAECWACGASWTQRYVFVGDEEIEPGEGTR